MLDDVFRLERFQNRCLRVILKIFFATHGQVSNSAIRQKAESQPSVEQLIRTRRLRWFGRAYNMHSSRLPNKILSAQPPHGKRPQGKRFLTWHEILRSDFEQLYITETWHDLVSNEKTWKKTNYDPTKAKSPWQGCLRYTATEKTDKLSKQKVLKDPQKASLSGAEVN